jgi:hypothetical protein
MWAGRLVFFIEFKSYFDSKHIQTFLDFFLGKISVQRQYQVEHFGTDVS